MSLAPTSRIGKTCILACLCAAAFVLTAPFMWMLLTSLKPADETMTEDLRLLPSDAREVRITFADAPASALAGPAFELRAADGVTLSVWLSVDGAGGPPAGASASATLVVPVRTHAGLPMVLGSRTAGFVADALNGTGRFSALRRGPLVLVKGMGPWAAGPTRLDDAAATTARPAPLAVEVDSGLRWRNYPDAMRAMGRFWAAAGNSLFLCIVCAAGAAFSSALAAYGFSRIPWRGRDGVFVLVMATMMIPFPVVMVPVFALFKALGWIGSFKPLIAPAFMAGAFNVFLLRQFFLGVPQSLAEAARIDGAGEWTIFSRIMLPLVRPGLICVALFTFLATWNDYLGPLIYLADERDFTLAVSLDAFSSKQGGQDWHLLMAASVLTLLPVLAVFFVAQRHFIQGLSGTGGKEA